MSVAVGVYNDYSSLALNWRPSSRTDKIFKRICWIVLSVMIIASSVVTLVEIPEKERVANPAIPERIAQFIIEKEKVEIEKPQEKKIEEKKVVKKKPEKEQAVTKKQQEAREVAEKSGVLALKDQLSDLMDTSEINSMISSGIKKSGPSSAEATLGIDAIESGYAKGSEGFSASDYISQPASSGSAEVLSDKKKLTVQQSLAKAGSYNTTAKSSERSREEIAAVFDRNKGRLYAAYSRARRTNPGLKGKLIFELTIAASGKVTSIKIISSELQDKKLESSLLARIRNFDFGARDVSPVTVTYPIEFLPS